ncbi:hypothetical protein OIU78_021500 [Salix suchowensis]|nr:hypothetical protein OIU78_021500 [Salix suchowensis]
MFFCRKNFCSVFQPSDFERLYRSCANCCVCFTRMWCLDLVCDACSLVFLPAFSLMPRCDQMCFFFQFVFFFSPLCLFHTFFTDYFLGSLVCETDCVVILSLLHLLKQAQMSLCKQVLAGFGCKKLSLG